MRGEGGIKHYMHVMSRAPSSVAVIGTKIKRTKQNTVARVDFMLYASIIIFIESSISFLGNLMMFCCYCCKCLVEGMYVNFKNPVNQL